MLYRRGSARRAAGPRLPTSLVSVLVFAAPDTPPEPSPASTNLCGRRRPGAGAYLADFLVLRVRPRDALGPPGTCRPRVRAFDFATPQGGAGSVFAG